MYLGVHTPLDVGVSVIIAVFLIFALYPLIDWLSKRKSGLVVYFSCLLVLSVAFLIYVLAYPFPADIDPHNYESGVSNAYKILGCLVGLFAAYIIDAHYLHFDVKGSAGVQITKLVLGIIPLLAIKEGLRATLSLLVGDMLGSGVRYLLIAFFAGAIWPMTFPRIKGIVEKIAKKRKT